MGMSGKRGHGWSDLPRELLDSIADRLGNSIDVSRFRSVCESWRSSAKPFSEPISFPLRLPHLGSPTNTNNNSNSFSLLSQSTLYHLSDPPSSSSWLLKLRPQEDKGQRQTHLLLNPLSPLPITPLPESFPTEIDSSRFRVSELARAYSLHLSSGFSGYKVALSLTRSLVAVVAAGVLVELDLKSPDRRWRVIDDVSSQLSYQDVVLYGDRFIATDSNGRTVEIASGHKASVIARQVAASGGGDKKSLVVGGEELLLVDAYVAKGGRGERFRVYRLSESERRWDEVRTLEEDRVVFLGEDCAFSVPAGDLGPGFKGNCVIYRDPAFMVFTLGDQRVSSLAWRPEYAQLFHPPAQRRVHKDSVSCLFNSLCL